MNPNKQNDRKQHNTSPNDNSKDVKGILLKKKKNLKFCQFNCP